jgi:hypothetical protein
MRWQIERGDTYPMVEKFTPTTFAAYFFGNFACLMIDTTHDKTEFWREEHPDASWNSVIYGSFYVLPPCLILKK